MEIPCPLCGQPTPTPADILATRATCVRCGQSFALDALPTMVPASAPTPATVAPTESLAGRRLGGCRLVRVIGRGGMGEVYEAMQESLNRKVAVKVLPPGLAKDEAFIKRFNRESGALAQLSHPHIVAIYDRGCEDGHYYFVLEHVEGPGGGVAETLHQRLRNGPGIAPGDCSRLMLQITEALAYAHGKGVIHRDIKPSNILLDARGHARLVDFGIARLVDAGPVEDHQLTLTGEVLGTTGYLAPEQREGRNDVDGRADIYSCGVMLYQMLTGRMPEGVFELPSEVVPGLPPGWDAAVEMALHRSPARRCQSMTEFLQAIRAVADGQAPPSRPRTAERQTPSPTAGVRSPDTNAQRTPVVGKCAKCGTVNAGDNRFCVECGVNLYEGCPACNAENRIGIKFCGQCGVDIGRHRRRADQRGHALALAARAGSLPAEGSVPLWREACQVWSKLLAEVPDDAAGQTARNEVQDRFSSAVLLQAQELNEQAKSQPVGAAVLLLRQSDKLLADLLAENPECLPARAGREELQRLIPARLLQASEYLLGQATQAAPEAALELLRQAEALLKKLGAEFPDHAPAKEVHARAVAQLRAAYLQHVRSRPPGDVATAFREMLVLFPGDAEAAEGLELELEKLRERGAELVRRGQFPEAIAHLEEALSKSPGDGELLALKVQAAEDREKFQALDTALAVRERERCYQAALGLAVKMLALCPDSENLAARHKQAAQAVETARQQTEEGERFLQRGRFVKAHEVFGAAVKSCADAEDRRRKATVACVWAAIVGVQLVIALAWLGSWGLNRRAWAETQAAVQAAGADDAKVQELYQTFLKNSSSSYDTTRIANAKLAETKQRIAELEAKLVTEKRHFLTGSAMRRAGFHEGQIKRFLTQGGSVVAWGYNREGQTAVPVGLAGVVAIAAGAYHTMALKQDGSVVAWGHNGYGQTTVPAGLSGVVAIEARGSRSMALKRDGSVVAWGHNGSGQTSVPSDLSGVVAMAAGFEHTVALRQDGSVVAWGKNSDGQTTVPAGLSGVVAIAAGGSHTLALRQDGSVVAWGQNDYGQTTVPAGLSGVVAIAAGDSHTLALRQDGSVVAWGANTLYRQTIVPEGLSGVVAITAGLSRSMALKRDGSVVAWGNYTFGETAVPAGLSGVVAIADGGSHTVVLTQVIY